MQRLIELEDIFKIYTQGDSEIRALDSVSLCIKQGEFVAIVGASGSGKSTLMNMLGCLDSPSSGSYLLDGDNVSALSDKTLSFIRNRKIGFIFQGFNLIPGLTALENVELPLIYRKIPKAERRRLSAQALQMVSLENRMNHRPCQMSGGQQQRVAIARAIAGQPSIILADEPTGNLDSSSGNEVMEILKSLNKDGKTVILITHDLTIAAQAMRIIKISDGKIQDE
ncbi:MAG: ABC transporter ATP-binding protein [Oscillospiraceae bacterium]|jgi:putative ABC transport system ATP-binding protein